MDALGAVIALIAGIGGVGLGAMLARRNERRARAEHLLVEALNDAVRAIASVAGGEGPEALRLYAGAVSRVALHGSPTVITAFRRFQDDATTVTDEGRDRLLAAIRAARTELGHRPANDDDLRVLLFGAGPVDVKKWDQEAALVIEHVVASTVSSTPQDADVERLMTLVDSTPVVAVLESFNTIENALRALAVRSGVGDVERKTATQLAQEAQEVGTTTPEVTDAVRGLTVLRELAAHGTASDMTPQRAREFVVLVNAVLYALERSNRQRTR